ncbi:MAG: tol-pal system protein YbgF [Octadecabacter sp.]|nr:tol-pal system protein YbgF [Octadecabacter sp.]
MLRRAALIAACLMGFATPGIAQDNGQTLAGIRQELSVLFVEIQRLRAELNTTGGADGSGSGGSILSRVDGIEAELRRLTALTEDLDLRINRVVADGTNRIGDLEFRLCELEPACDIASLGETPNLGGVEVSPGAAPVAPSTGGADSSGMSLAVAEQDDFDRARAAYDAGEFARAADLFAAFTQTYPGGPLSAEAHFMRGQSEAQQSAWSRAARAYLDAFTADPNGRRAAEALLNLGASLARLDQIDEACVTLAEVGIRFPDSVPAADAEIARQNIGCP